jgi:hypothetical protein
MAAIVNLLKDAVALARRHQLKARSAILLLPLF